MLWREQGLLYLAWVLLDEAAGYIYHFLGVAVGVPDLQLLPIADYGAEVGEQGYVGAGEGVDGLPVVADRDDLGVAYLLQGLNQIESLF